MRFCDIPGHEDVKERLHALVDSGRMPHALLIEGPEGSAKFALAQALAQYMHCQNRRNGDSCGRCPACQQHQTFNHVDTIYSFPIIKGDLKDPVSEDRLPEFREFISEHPFMDYEQWLSKLDNVNGQPQIYVSEANELMRKLSFTSHGSQSKVVILWLPEKLNEGTANKLLKLVEEPLPDTVFIMVSNKPSEILPTIYSRVQRVQVKRYPDQVIHDFLAHGSSDPDRPELMRGYHLSDTDAWQIAKLAAGNISQAVSLISVSKDRKAYLELFIRLMRKAYTRTVLDLKQWAADLAALGRERQMAFYEYCARMIRENFILNMHVSELNCLSDEEMQFSSRFSPFINERNVLKIFQTFNDARNDIAANANAKLVNFDVAVKIILLLK